MKQTNVFCFLLFLVILAAPSGAQEYHSVPLDHAAYDIIAMGVTRGVIVQPPTAKPWPLRTVTEKLWEMIEDPEQILSSKEVDMVVRVADSLERETGFVPEHGRYRTEGGVATFEAGFGWESVFSVESSGGSLSSVNRARLYAGGDLADFASWNVAVSGGFFYIEREANAIPPVFPYAFVKQWDGGVLSLSNPGADAGWPDDPSLAYGLEAELNGAFFDQRAQFRLGRLRHDWGYGMGNSLFLNAHAHPFTALEGTVLPLSWLNVSVLGGALERENIGQFTNALSAARLDFNPVVYVHFDLGAAAVLPTEPRAAVFAGLELRLPGLFSLWGNLFVDRLDSPSENIFSANSNSYAFQGGIKTVVHWLPLGAFTLHYTKVEPYCYNAFVSGGESLGYYMPPNSDELLVRLESRLFSGIKAHVQFQMIRHGVDYGYGAVPGSSLHDKLDNGPSIKYFLMDGVYRWDNIIKLGGSFNFKAGGVPLSVFTEMGLVVTNFTINGTAGVGNEADYETLNDEIYRGNSSFIFSIGFRLYP